MNIIKLKYCNLVDIKTNIQFYDNGMWGSYHETNVINEVSFVFDNGVKFICNLFDVDFAKFLDFFYKKDFSETITFDFICNFIKAVPISYKGSGYNLNRKEIIDCYVEEGDNEYMVFMRDYIHTDKFYFAQIDKKTFDDLNGYLLDDRKKAIETIISKASSVDGVE